MLIHHRAGLALGSGPVELAEEVPPRAKPLRGDVRGQVDIGHLQADARLIIESERVERRAEQAAALAHHGLQSLVQLAPQDDIGRQHTRGRASVFGDPSDDRARAGTGRAGETLTAQIHRPVDAPGQRDRPGHAVIVRLMMHGAEQRELVGPFRQSREQLANAHARDG